MNAEEAVAAVDDKFDAQDAKLVALAAKVEDLAAKVEAHQQLADSPTSIIQSQKRYTVSGNKGTSDRKNMGI